VAGDEAVLKEKEKKKIPLFKLNVVEADVVGF
jgi:hypothetical protein